VVPTGVRRRVLLLSPFFSPEPISTGKYNAYLAAKLVEKGAVIDVIASHALYPDWRPRRCNESPAGIVVHRGGAWMRYPRSTHWRRLLLELWFCVHVLTCAWRIRKEVDIAVAVFPPALFFAPLSKLLPKNIRRIGIVHDLQGVYAGVDRGIISRMAGRFAASIEKRAFCRCDGLIFLSESMLKRAISEYDIAGIRAKVCYPFETISSVAETTNDLASVFQAGKCHVVYSGALGRKQCPEGLISFFEFAGRRLENVCFHIFSGGPIFERLKQEVGENGIIKLHNLVPEINLKELYARSDIQLIPHILEADDAAFPSKLPNIVASGCYVFAVCNKDSEVARIVEETQLGIVADSWAPEVLTAALEPLVAQARQNSRNDRVQRVRSVVGEMFQVSAVVDEILRHERGDAD
jgi:colanic acid biosynthesis glycosyl transferase WcaI